MTEPEKIMCFIKENLSHLDFNELQELEALIKSEKLTWPEEISS